MPRQSATRKYTPTQVWPLFSKLLPNQLILDWIRKQPRRFYQRLFPPLVVLWGFIFQRLNSDDHTCDALVSYLGSGAAVELRAAAGVQQEWMSENTAGYCKARQRLPRAVTEQALRHTAQTIRADLGADGLWRGCSVCLLDGSTLRMKAEEPLLNHFGQAPAPNGSSHWPRLRLVVGFDLLSGAVTDLAEGPYTTSEVALAIQLIRQSALPMVYVGDRLYAIYHLAQVIYHCQQDALFRLQAGRVGRLAKRPLLSGSDLDVVWNPSKRDQLEADLPAAGIPGRLIYVHLERPGFRPIDLYLFTTLTDREQFPLEALVQLYGYRWQAELNLRHVKTSLDMHCLDGRLVDIVQKELILGLVAYNLIRALMAQAGRKYACSPLELSFKKCWRRIAHTLERLPAGCSDEEVEQHLARLLKRLATCRLPKRKKVRYEPRRVRRKPQPYRLLVGSRDEARKKYLDSLAPKS
jgi:hypothetical protein